MSRWKSDPNKRAISIVRRSGHSQKDNTSAETQERENLDYAVRNGLDLIKCESIIESAFKTENRKKYRALMQFALSQGVKHILFYIGSREARNLTDNEKNEKLIKEGKIIIHYVSENKVFDTETPDSEFLAKDIIAAVNKNYSRENGTKMKAAYRTKAEKGWWPYRHTPLGYVHFKEKDAYGNAIKGTAKLTPDPDPTIVRLVRREFELRAQGFSYDLIRKKNIEDNIVPAELVGKYSRHGIEERLKNSLYWGYFFLAGETKRFEGKHELIIPARILKAVEAVNSERTCRRKMVVNGDDIFRGWLTCAHPECQRAITYERKEKTLKATGEAKVYHLYRCSNSRKVHAKKVYIQEEKIWEQFEPTTELFTITQEFADDIAAELSRTEELHKAAVRKQMEGFRIELKALEGREDRVYQDHVAGVLDQSGYRRQISRIREDRDHFTSEIERLQVEITHEAWVSVKKVFELAINAKEKWKTLNREDRIEYLKKVCSNPTLEGLTLEYQLQKPFARLARWKTINEWRREVSLLRTESVAWAG